MPDYTQTAADDNLVHRYAARIRAPHASCRTGMISGRRTHGIQTFGRVPVKSKRFGSARSRRAITTLMATAIMASSTPALSSAQASSSYDVQPGDTLTGIARNHGVSIDELIRINGIENPDKIRAGAAIQLGEQDKDEEAGEIREGDTVYEIQTGDTLMSIASEHGVTLSELLAINEIENSDMIYVGDFLIIPTSLVNDGQPGSDAAAGDQDSDDQNVTESTAEPVEDDASHIIAIHLVANGESLSSIAARYDITVDQLMQANDLDDVDMVRSGEMLRIPDPSWTPAEASRSGDATDQTGSSGSLENMPVHQQSLSQSSEAAAMTIATSYWDHQVSEWVFIENMPYHQNPHRGYRGDMDGASGGTTNYGVYPKPLSAMLSNYGFVGEEFYTMGDPLELKDRIDRGQPVLAWMTEGATRQDRFFEWYQGERFTLVPYQHVVVVHGYDDENVYVSDPGTGQYATYSWNAFINSWSQFDGMSMAVYPKG